MGIETENGYKVRKWEEEEKMGIKRDTRKREKERELRAENRKRNKQGK